jgi:hypothetical protein
MKKYLFSLIPSVLFITAFGQDRYFHATLSGASEVPPIASTASGIVIFKFNTITKALELFGN